MDLLLADNGQLFGLSPTTWRALEQLDTLIGYLFLLAALLGYLKRERIRRWLHRNTFPAVGGDLAAAHERYEALVFTFSRPELPRWVIEQLRPRWVGFVASHGQRTGLEALMAALREAGHTVEVRTVDDPDAPEQSRARTEELIQAARAAGHARVAVDVTGGKVPMSLGAFMAAEEHGLATLYVTADYANGRITPCSQRIRRISSPA